MKRFNENCMLIKVGIKMPGAKQLVSRASQEAANKFRADAESIDSHIRKFRKTDLAPAQELATAARQKIKFYTDAWDDNGWRICKTEHWPELSKQLEEFKLKFDDTVGKIVNENYEEIKADAQRRAGDLWEDIRFPEKDEFAGQFDFVIEMDEIKDPKDIKIAGPSGLLREMQAQMETRNEKKLVAAQGEAKGRLTSVLDDTITRLKHYGDGKAKFNKAKTSNSSATKVRISDSVINNVVAVAKVFNKINLTNDEELDKAANEMAEVFSKFQGKEQMKELRDNPKKREEVISKSSEILDSIKKANL